VNESPVGFQSRGALRKSEAKMTGANNRNLAVFAPGNSRRNFSKNCFPVAHPPMDCRFEIIRLFGRHNQPLKMNL
jgi:hypothetical protein